MEVINGETHLVKYRPTFCLSSCMHLLVTDLSRPLSHRAFDELVYFTFKLGPSGDQFSHCLCLIPDNVAAERIPEFIIVEAHTLYSSQARASCVTAVTY